MKQFYTSKEILELTPAEKSVISVIGCCGKTTFIDRLATSYSENKVLISPTTKIGIPEKENILFCQTLEECEQHTPVSGIQYMGIGGGDRPKLSSLPLELLATVSKQYDLSLFEADGSRCLPCKGWLDTEPVIPPYTTHTVGIVTFGGLGKPASARYILRLPQFLTLTDLRENETITEKALCKMVCSDGGMFKNSVGRRFLFINQIESPEEEQQALAWIDLLNQEYPHFFEKIVFGSAQKNLWKES